MRNEVKVAKTLVHHNIPLALANELTPFFQDIFSDSKIAKNYSSRRTKRACIITGAVAPFFQQNLVEHIKKNPFSIAIGGSSDNDIEKMNLLTVRIFYAGTSALSFLTCACLPPPQQKRYFQRWTTPSQHTIFHGTTVSV